ncbi:MAG: NAD(P)-dependent alcohol dehydrogenase [Bdellovibrionota bacterium]
MFCTGYRSLDYLRLVDVDKPVLGESDLLIEVKFSSVQTADWRIQSFEMPKGMGTLARLIFGFSKPRQPILGTEISGVIKATGPNVKTFKVGDEVVAVLGAKFGGHAEFIKVKEDSLILKKPSNMKFQEAACLSFGGLTALDFLKYKANVKSREHVLIHGASGAVGLAAIQIAKHLGAVVTAVCSQENFPLVRSIGADFVLDYSKEAFWKSETKYDVIFDIIGNFKISEGLDSLKDFGRLVLIAAGLEQMLFGSVQTISTKKKVITGVGAESKDLLLELIQLYERGQYKSIIDREYSLEQIPEAYKYTSGRHKRGNVVINIGGVRSRD